MTGYRADPGSGAGTDWSTYDVPAMWSMIEDFDVDPHWRHVGGWRKASELAERHLVRMRTYREQLASSWPPSPGSASSVYLGELDKLIASLQATYESAVANYGVMSAATRAIADVRDKLKPLYERWQSSESTMAAFEAAVSSTRSGLPAPAPGPPPLSPQWRDELNARARGVMEGASSELALASLRIVTPLGYTAPPAGRDNATDWPTAGIGIAVPQTFTSPAVPKAAPRRDVGAEGSKSVESVAGRGVTTLISPGSKKHLPPNPVVLDRMDPPPTAPARRAGVLGPANPNPTSRHQTSPVVSSGSAISSTKSLPPGGVIGVSPPGLFGRQDRQPVQQVNPPGGVLAGRSAVGAARQGPRRTGDRLALASNPAESPSFRTPDGHVISISNSALRSDRVDPPPEWDSDSPWLVDIGVRPVIEPTVDSVRHDPGPAIGLER